MKTVFNLKNITVMKNYMKYICAFLLLLGASAHASGSVTYKVWNGSSYDNDGTVEIGGTLKEPVSVCPALTAQGWVTSEYEGDGTGRPTIYGEGGTCPSATNLYLIYRAQVESNYYYSTHPNLYTITYDLTHVEDDGMGYTYTCASDFYSKVEGSLLDKGTLEMYLYTESGYDEFTADDITFTYTDGGATFEPSTYEFTPAGGDYYMVYIEGIDGDITITAEARNCLTLESATNLAVNTRYVNDAKTYVRFSWTLGSGTARFVADSNVKQFLASAVMVISPSIPSIYTI